MIGFFLLTFKCFIHSDDQRFKHCGYRKILNSRIITWPIPLVPNTLRLLQRWGHLPGGRGWSLVLARLELLDRVLIKRRKCVLLLKNERRVRGRCALWIQPVLPSPRMSCSLESPGIKVLFPSWWHFCLASELGKTFEQKQSVMPERVQDTGKSDQLG